MNSASRRVLLNSHTNDRFSILHFQFLYLNLAMPTDGRKLAHSITNIAKKKYGNATQVRRIYFAVANHIIYFIVNHFNGKIINLFTNVKCLFIFSISRLHLFVFSFLCHSTWEKFKLSVLLLLFVHVAFIVTHTHSEIDISYTFRFVFVFFLRQKNRFHRPHVYIQLVFTLSISLSMERSVG